jgi:antitoxin VapB
MTLAKLFKHGGSQAVRLPKAFRFPGSEVVVEKRGDSVVLRPKPHPRFKSLGDVARYMATINVNVAFPDRDQPKAQDRDLTW